jgi:hypothetical protein
MEKAEREFISCRSPMRVKTQNVSTTTTLSHSHALHCARVVVVSANKTLNGHVLADRKKSASHQVIHHSLV